MFNRKVIALIILLFCFFESSGKDMNNQTIDKKMGKPVYSSTLVSLDTGAIDKYCYTTELSRILLTGEPRVFEILRLIPLINSLMQPVFAVHFLVLNNRFFDSRFSKFIKKSEKHSQSQLQEAIEDAIVLTAYNTNAYSVSRLLDYLAKVLQGKVVYIKDQIGHDSKWDQRSLRSLKKSGAWAAGLMAVCIISNKYNAENINGIAGLGVIAVSCQMLKSGYKFLTVNPNASNDNLDKYEELLLFVQKLKEQLQANGSIVLALRNGNTATIKDHRFSTTVTFS